MTHKLIKTENYLLIVDDSEIKVGDWIRWNNKITKAIDTAYTPSTKKIIAHLPLNHLPILKGVPLLPPYSLHQEDVINELAEISSELQEGTYTTQHKVTYKHGFVDGYNKAKEKFLLELEKQIIDFTHDLNKTSSQHQPFEGALYGLNRLKYYLSQYPREFECEMIPCNPIKYTTEDHLDVEPKTITTAQGIQWVGKYK